MPRVVIAHSVEEDKQIVEFVTTRLRAELWNPKFQKMTRLEDLTPDALAVIIILTPGALATGFAERLAHAAVTQSLPVLLALFMTPPPDELPDGLRAFPLYDLAPSADEYGWRGLFEHLRALGLQYRRDIPSTGLKPPPHEAARESGPPAADPERPSAQPGGLPAAPPSIAPPARFPSFATRDDDLLEEYRTQIEPRKDARFAAYYPRETRPQTWIPLKAYLYRAHAVDLVAQDAREELRGAADIRRVEEASRAALAEGALVTATPNLPGFQCNPPSITLGFFEDWHRFDFKLRTQDAPLEQAANGEITFTVEGVIVADLPLSVYVTEQPNAAAEAEILNAEPYAAIFCSYSRRDTAIVERVERAYRALGLEFLRDVTALRSGEDWDDALLDLIDQADIFQLFWSIEAAASPYVRKEWEHALRRMQREELEAFIRPVYWQQPLAPVPPELSSIHFAYVPLAD